jgi:hypothetical protein
MVCLFVICHSFIIHHSSFIIRPLAFEPVAEDRSTAFLIVLAVVVLGIIAGVLALVRRAASPTVPASPVLTEEEKAYFPAIVVSDARMTAAQNFLGGTVTYLDAKVINNGTKTVRRLDLQLEFVDTLNQVVLRETAHAIASRAPPLKPGETRAFRVSFDHMPVDWNQASPTITVKYLGF